MSLKDYKKQIVKKIVDNSTAVEITKKVYYHNTIVRMNNKFSLEEEKALHIIFSYIKPFLFENATTVQIENKQFFKQLGLDSENKYNRYRKIVRRLINKTFFEIKESNGDEIMGVAIYNSKWYSKKSHFVIKLNSEFIPYIEQLKN